MHLTDRYRDALLGLAVGDALGTTLEFNRPGTFTPITDMIGGGPFNLEPGQWTDDTSMALCLKFRGHHTYFDAGMIGEDAKDVASQASRSRRADWPAGRAKE
jgi:ADP-ribosylglycohydrolase